MVAVDDASVAKLCDDVAQLRAMAMAYKRERDALAVQLGNVIGMVDVLELLGELFCDAAEDQAVLHDAREALKAHRDGTLSELLDCCYAEEAAEVNAKAGA